MNTLISNPALKRWFTLTHISLTIVGLMWVLPFLNYYHQYPITTFYQEWGAALLGLSAGIFLLQKQHWEDPRVPRIVVLPLALLVLILAQYMLGKITYFDQALMFALYMLWIILLMLLGRALRVSMGLPRMALVLGIFLLLGSELSALVGVLQHYRFHTFLDPVITAKVSIAVYGNVAQPNHFANYMMLGLISLGYMRMHLRGWQIVLLATPLLFVMVLSGSRSSWLYLLALAAMAYFWQRRDTGSKGLLGYVLMLLAGFGLMHAVVQLPWLAGPAGSVTTLQRIMSGETSGSIRLYLWHEAWLIFKQFPLMGAGWGQFAWQHFQLGPELRATYINGLYNNAHNILIHFAAETGVAGVLILLTGLGNWLWHVLHGQLARAHWWALGLLAVLSIHSMLEYPLWYVYFIGIVSILLGALDTQSYKLERSLFGRVSTGLVVVLGTIILLQLQAGYQELERAISSKNRNATLNNPDTIRDTLIKIHKMPLLQPYAEIFLNSYIEIKDDDLQAKLAWSERAAQFIPLDTVVYRRSLLLALQGSLAEAKRQLECSIWSYPRDFPRYRNELSALAQKDPAHFSALLEFAIQKNEEYSRAVSVR